MITLRMGGRRATLLQRGRRIASFSVEGLTWWRELFGDVTQIDDSFANLEKAAKAYLFAKLYPYVHEKYRLVKTLREMDDFVAVYWMWEVKNKGLRAIVALKKLYQLT
ncbi:MAG: hypothetical protein ACO2PM_16625 [Pyrobaculum sp.]|jgi:hypothetical protein